MNITYHENREIDTKELIELYKSVEWSEVEIDDWR